MWVCYDHWNFNIYGEEELKILNYYAYPSWFISKHFEGAVAQLFLVCINTLKA